MIGNILDFLRSLTDPERLIQLLTTLLTGWVGYTALAGVVFAETGLLLGFFLPGDSLLFTAGVLAGQGKLSIWLLLPGAFVGAFLGAEVGYLIGRRAGPRLFSRPDSRFFKQEYVNRTREFFD